jgi:translation elongation factor EF-1alpha
MVPYWLSRTELLLGDAQVTVTTLKASTATITVTDVQGKILVKQTNQLPLGTSQVAVDIAKLASGNYLLQISGTDFHLQQPFVKE